MRVCPVSNAEFNFLYDLHHHGWNWTNKYWFHKTVRMTMIYRLEKLGFLIRGEAGSWKPTEQATRLVQEAIDGKVEF